MSHVIRILITLVFIAGAYTETGFWTAGSLLLIAIALELLAVVIRDNKQKELSQ